MAFPTPSPGAQYASVMNATARLNLWEGAVRSGKTTGSVIAFLEHMATGPRGPSAMIGYTQKSVVNNVLEPLREWAGKGAVQIRRGASSATVYGRELLLFGANNVTSADAFRGITLARAYGDEPTIWHPDVWKMALSRLSLPGAALFAAMNPDRPNHPILTEFLDREDELDLARFTFRLEDNPHLPADYIAALKAEYSPPTSLWYRRFILGEWVLAEGIIWGAWSAELLTDAIPDPAEWYVAIDYGTVNPFVALLLAVSKDPRDPRIHVASEWRWDSAEEGSTLTDAEYSAELQSWLRDHGVKPRRIFVDPSAASFITQLWRDKVRGVVKADNTVADGLRNVNTLMGARLITVNAALEDLIGEIEGYVWDAKSVEKGHGEQPVKADDHGPDALRYGVMGVRQAWTRWLKPAA